LRDFQATLPCRKEIRRVAPAEICLFDFLRRRSLDVMKSLGLILAGLLFLSGGCNRGVKHGVEVVLAVGTNEVSQISSNDMRRVVTALARRMDKLGFPSEVKAMGENRVSVKLPFAAVESMGKQRTLLTRGGSFELRLVHEESTRLAQDGLAPGGYSLMYETRIVAGGRKQLVPYVVSRQRVAGVSSTNISKATIIRGTLNEPQLAFQLDDAGRAAFAKVTGENVGRQLAIVLDGELYSAPTIRAPITEGTGVISGGGMTGEDVRELVLLLQFPLEKPVRVVEERTF
jgi:SecD/SecF fusion protein